CANTSKPYSNPPKAFGCRMRNSSACRIFAMMSSPTRRATSVSGARSRAAPAMARARASSSATSGRSEGTAADASVPALVHQRALLDPRHHVAQLGADLLGRVLGELGARRLERGLVDPVLQHPVLGEAAGGDVGEDALHLGARLLRDHARA